MIGKRVSQSCKEALEGEKLLAKKIFAIMQRKCFSMTLEKFRRGNTQFFCSEAERESSSTRIPFRIVVSLALNN